MRKLSILIVGISLTVFSTLYSGVFNDLTNEISDKVFAPIANVISSELANHMGFYTGSGNMIWASPRPFLGLEVGAGIGVNMSQVFRQALKKDYSAFQETGTNRNATMANKLSAAVALFPFPYDLLYVKIGLPDIPLDIGLRAGYIPIPTVFTSDNVSFYASVFHIGAEGRYRIWKFLGGFITVNGTVSLDYNGGGMGVNYSNVSEAYVSDTLVGTNVATMGMNIGWGGVSLGSKMVAAMNIAVVGGIFAGIGLNANIGSASTELSMKGTFIDLGGTNYSLILGKNVPNGYNFLDVRLVAGFQLLFVSFSLEYGLLNKDLALNLFPIALSF